MNKYYDCCRYKDGSRLLEEKENPRIRMHARTLTISKATEADAGEYTCVIEMAGLSYPFADHLGSRIKVTYPARVEKFPRQIRPILNRNLNLECEVQGFPVPRVSWFVDGFPIEEFRLNDSRYDAVDNPQGMPGSVLFIQDVDYEDNRQITCTTDNIDGADETTAQLAVRAINLKWSLWWLAASPGPPGLKLDSTKEFAVNLGLVRESNVFLSVWSRK
ncbi:hypothetical protein AVEN_206125-1 [Araneus ventricosus]|uniref:Ig-like domain-containing protein n=1 Tax=Araneus ventricosus TaxID=182803 RepID=A0A4Y2KQ50_ARAVE|nr:hypothetical protein AVEN_206125-1 [Araneus ventricosus]